MSGDSHHDADPIGLRNTAGRLGFCVVAVMIALIGAVSRNGMMGKAGWLPWDIPDELGFFLKTIVGRAIVVGRISYEAMEVVPPDTIIVTRQTDIELRPGCVAAASMEIALSMACATGKDVLVIGGASAYKAAWPYCDRAYLTTIEHDFDGDTRFPDLPVWTWPLTSARIEFLQERNLGREVACRFEVYSNPAPVGLRASGD